MLYVVVRRGDSPDTARPVLATSDPAVLRAVAQALEERLRETGWPVDSAPLRLVRGAAKRKRPQERRDE